MKKILLSAFACRPLAGSEWGVGWNFFIELSKVFEVHLITEGEFKEEIYLACKGLGIDKSRLHFLDLTPEARKRCHNQGDWRFYIDYRKWQKQVYKYAKDLHENEKFEIVHHLNMIGFREPGDLWKLGTPFVLGPLGGFGNVPDKFFDKRFSISRIKNHLKIFLNHCSLYLPYVRQAIKNADIIIAAYPEAIKTIRDHYGKDSVLISETGCNMPTEEEILKHSMRSNLVWIGKNVHRKQFNLAARAFLKSELSRTENLIVIGNFSNEIKRKWANAENIIFLGHMSKESVFSHLGKARGLLFTSVHEGNPHVVFESISVGTPVICHDSFGMGNIVDETVGIKIRQVSFSQSLEHFSKAIDELKVRKFDKESFLKKIIENSWSERSKAISNLYARLVDF